MRRVIANNTSQRGFSMVELAVVIVIIGVLAAFAVPRFRDASERARAAEAFAHLSSIVSAQERYQAKAGSYAKKLDDLDMQQRSPKYFRVGRVTAGSTGDLQSSWRLTLTRQGATAGYGAYTVTFTQDGFDRSRSSISRLTRVNPMSN